MKCFYSLSYDDICVTHVVDTRHFSARLAVWPYRWQCLNVAL